MKNLITFSLLLFLLGCSIFEQKQMHLLVWESDFDKDGFKYALCQYTMTDVDSGYQKKILHSNIHYSSIICRIPDDCRVFQNQYIVSGSEYNFVPSYQVYDLKIDSLLSINQETFLNLKESKSFKAYDDIQSFLNQSSQYYYADNPFWKKSTMSFFPKDGFYAPNQTLKVSLSIDSLKTYITSKKDSLYSKDLSCLWRRSDIVYRNIIVLDTNDTKVLSVPIEYVSHDWNPYLVPIVWYDNEHLVSIQENHQVILIHVPSKKVINFPKLENVELCGIPEFHVNELGDLYYVLYSSKKIWKVNVQDLELEEVNQIPITSEVSKNFIRMHIGNTINTPNFYHNNKPIFKDSTLTSEYDHKNDWLAVRSIRASSEKSNLKIYNLKTKQHREIQIKNFVGWVGWIER